jgi:hypothetical protein
MEKNIISISGLALVEVTYNYEIKDLEKFKQAIKEKREQLSDLKDLWLEDILSYRSDLVEYVNVEYDGVQDDEAYHEINGWTDEVEKIIEENKLDELDEWYN